MIARIFVTALAVVLGAAVALVAPPAFYEVLDFMVGWTLIFAGAVVIALALDDAMPTLARFIGRRAFKVARAAYRVANR